METKGSVTHGQEGRAYIYVPTVSRDTVTHAKMNNLRQTLYRKNPTGFVAALLKDEGLSREDLEELRRLIDDYERRLP